MKSRRVELYVEWEEPYRVAKAVVTEDKVVVVSASTLPGDHVTYPQDGRVHRTIPGVGRSFQAEEHPPLSNVTFRVFHEIEVSSTGPPRGATPVQNLPPDAFVVSAPTHGKAIAFAAVLGSSDPAIVQPYIEELSSASTYRIGRGPAGVVLLGWDRTGFL